MTREEEVVERLRAAGQLVKRIEMKGGVAPIATESALSAAEQAISEAAALIEQLVAERDAYITLLYTDEVFVGTHWDGDFRKQETKSWPVLCAHFPNFGADAEEIPQDQIVPLADLVGDFGAGAVVAWVCHRRGLEAPPKGGLSVTAQAALSAIRSRSPSESKRA